MVLAGFRLYGALRNMVGLHIFNLADLMLYEVFGFEEVTTVG